MYGEVGLVESTCSPRLVEVYIILPSFCGDGAHVNTIEAYTWAETVTLCACYDGWLIEELTDFIAQRWANYGPRAAHQSISCGPYMHVLEFYGSLPEASFPHF